MIKLGRFHSFSEMYDALWPPGTRFVPRFQNTTSNYCFRSDAIAPTPTVVLHGVACNAQMTRRNWKREPPLRRCRWARSERSNCDANPTTVSRHVAQMTDTRNPLTSAASLRWGFRIHKLRIALLMAEQRLQTCVRAVDYSC